MADIEQILRRELYRVLCPAPEQLGEFQLGVLSADQAKEVELHIHECPHCRAEIKLLERYLDDLETEIEFGLGERIRIWIAKLIPSPGPELVTAFGLRGDEINGLLHYIFGEGGTGGELTLEVQEDPSQPGRRVLLGLLTGVPGGGLQAALKQDGRPVAQGEIDEYGNLLLDNLAPGTYELLLTGSEFEIQVQELKVL